VFIVSVGFAMPQLCNAFAGIAVDGNSTDGNAQTIILVKRSGKVVELEQEINGMLFVCLVVLLFSGCVLRGIQTGVTLL